MSLTCTIPIIWSIVPLPTGYTESMLLPTICLTFSPLAFCSSQCISVLCVIMDLTFRSPIMKTRSTISCSTSCTSPSLAPSSIIDFISASVTFVSLSLIPKSATIPLVLFDSIQTNGSDICDRNSIGPAIVVATFWAAFIPIFFGTSSPKMSVKYVTATTIIVCESACA